MRQNKKERRRDGWPEQKEKVRKEERARVAVYKQQQAGCRICVNIRMLYRKGQSSLR